MTERTALGERILDHWRQYRPQMVSDLEQSHRLEQVLIEAQEKTGELLYELVSVKKMDYQAAWELAMEEWTLPEPEVATAEKRPPSASISAKQSRRRNRRRRRTTSG